MNVRDFLAIQTAWEKANRRQAQGLCLGGNGVCVCVLISQSFLTLFHLMGQGPWAQSTGRILTDLLKTPLYSSS